MHSSPWKCQPARKTSPKEEKFAPNDREPFQFLFSCNVRFGLGELSILKPSTALPYSSDGAVKRAFLVSKVSSCWRNNPFQDRLSFPPHRTRLTIQISDDNEKFPFIALVLSLPTVGLVQSQLQLEISLKLNTE